MTTTMAQPAKKVTQTTTPTKSPAAADSHIPTKDHEKAIKDLETKVKAINTNNIARTANSHLVSADEKLHPLVSLKTGRAIDRFPETSKGLSKLSRMYIVHHKWKTHADLSQVTLVDAMLNALEADRTGKEDEKRERLRVLVGLKPNPA